MARVFGAGGARDSAKEPPRRSTGTEDSQVTNRASTGRGVPVFSLAVGLCAARKGLPASLLHDEPYASFALQLTTQRELGFDSEPFYFYATYGTWEHCAGLEYPSSELRATPTPPHYPVRDEADLERVSMPDVRYAGMLPAAMRFSELQQEHGLAVSIVIGDIFTVAANVCGFDRLCLWLIERPNLARRLLQLAHKHLREIVSHWAQTFGAARVTPIIWEGPATLRMISARHFIELVGPAQKELHEDILALGVRGLMYHVGAERTRDLGMWAEIPVGKGGMVSVGATVDLGEAGRCFPEAVLMGNVDPALLERGSPEVVRRQSLLCIELAKAHPGGFVLAPGDTLQVDIPPANLRVMVDTAKTWGGLDSAPARP